MNVEMHLASYLLPDRWDKHKVVYGLHLIFLSLLGLRSAA